jgi:outer membrane lipoprotein-sorting protein
MKTRSLLSLGLCRRWLAALILSGTVLTGSVAAGRQAGTDPGIWVVNLEKSYAEIESYSAIFHKQERVDGKLREEEMISLKFKKPFKVYMKWIKAPHKGREALYAAGWNKNQVRVHEAGILGLVTVNLDPNGHQAMQGNRHAITDTGLGNLVKVLRENVSKGLEAGELEFKEHGKDMVYGRKSQKIELVLPKARAKYYYCHRAVIHVDLETTVPIKVQIFDGNDLLIENYGFENLNLKAGLTDADFDPGHPAYKF